MSGWIGVDFDGTLATHGGDRAGEPIPAMVRRVHGWLQEGREVRIVTARVARSNASDLVEEAHAEITGWCLLHLGRALPVTAEKDYAMIELWDDRAVQVIPNTGETAQDFFSRVAAHEVYNELVQSIWRMLDDRPAETIVADMRAALLQRRRWNAAAP